MKDRGSIHARFNGRFGRFLLQAEFNVPARGVTALFGPSGCGKTSVLRCMAGLNRIDDGFLDIAGDVWQDGARFRPVHDRPIGYVFQEASLFQHLSVRSNLTYGMPKAKGSPDSTSFDEVVDLLGLAALLDRSPLRLSGGERQRVAIGRALLSQPKLLLMDEPLAALDKPTKDEILPFLERLHEALSLPVLYVSHDMSEVERLADHLILMEGGRVLAAGPIGRLQSDPALPLFKAPDAAVSLDAIVAYYDAANGIATLRVAGADFLVPSSGVQVGHGQRLRIHAGDVSLALERPTRSTILNILKARIIDVQETGEHQVTALLALGGNEAGAHLLSRVTRRSWNLLGLSPGMDVYAQVKGVALMRRSGHDHGPSSHAP